MSDPAKSQVAIEDVLSSIRRLVAEEGAAEPTAPNAPKPSAPEVSRPAPKLVLTDAQRVDEAETPPNEAENLSEIDDAESAAETNAEALDQTPELPDAVGASDREAEQALDDGMADVAGWAFEDRMSDWGPVARTEEVLKTLDPFDDSSDAGEPLHSTAPTTAALLLDIAAAVAPEDEPVEPEASDDAAHIVTEAMPSIQSVEAELDDAEPSGADLADLAALDGLSDQTDIAFEPETGDVDWPGTGADQALRQLAAVRSQTEAPMLLEADAVAPSVSDEIPSPPSENVAESDTVDTADASDDKLAAGSFEDAIAPSEATTESQAPNEDDTKPSDVAFKPVFSRRLSQQHMAPDHDEEPSVAAIDPEQDNDCDTEVPSSTEGAALAEGAEIEVEASVKPLEDRDPDLDDVLEDLAEPNTSDVSSVGIPSSGDPELSVDDLSSMDRPPEEAKADASAEPDTQAREAAAQPDLSHLEQMDEDALRDLIAEVVREELQGVLGERITRNVRKMVRREIRMALAAEQLD